MLLHPLAKFRKSGHQFGSIAVLLSPALDFFLSRLANDFIHQVPLVHDNDTGLPLLHNDIGYLFVLFRNATLSIQDKNRNIAASD